MRESSDFLRSVLDTIGTHVVVIDGSGLIRFANSPWRRFSRSNGGDIEEWVGVDYLAECDAAAGRGEAEGAEALDHIRAVMSGERDVSSIDYSCHSPDEVRYFLMTVTALTHEGARYYAVSHQNITERRLAEQASERLARVDSLTGIANRRRFEEFLTESWRRGARESTVLALALIDIDHFKALNDRGGHLAGDDLLEMVGKVLDTFACRPGDLCARYGGDEFALLLADATDNGAEARVGELLEAVRALPFEIPITASIGLATTQPDGTRQASALVRAADGALYRAKELGRDQMYRVSI